MNRASRLVERPPGAAAAGVGAVTGTGAGRDASGGAGTWTPDADPATAPPAGGAVPDTAGGVDGCSTGGNDGCGSPPALRTRRWREDGGRRRTPGHGRELERPAGRVHERERGVEALLLLLGHRSREHVVDRPRQVGALGRDAGPLVLQVREQDRDVLVLGERHLARQALVEDARERVQVRPSVDVVPADLLRCDVVDRPHERPGLGEAAAGRDVLGETEVAEVGVLLLALLRQQDVRGLHVPVHEPGPVGGVQGARDLPHDRRWSARRPSARPR